MEYGEVTKRSMNAGFATAIPTMTVFRIAMEHGEEMLSSMNAEIATRTPATIATVATRLSTLNAESHAMTGTPTIQTTVLTHASLQVAAMASYNQGLKSVTMALNVSEAMITTAAGLVLAIPALLMYYYIRGRVVKVIALVEHQASEFVELIVL